MKKKEISNMTRSTILDAAGRVVLNNGGDALTLEAAAREAGVSKGGLLYHFPTKNSLIKGMLERLISNFETELEQELNKCDGDWLVAYINASFAENPAHRQISCALFAAIANDLNLLQPLQARYSEWQTRVEALAPSPETGTLIRLALDGLWVSDLLGFAPPTPEMKQKLLDSLLTMAGKGK
jgi:AcrR family transcriptional regulator